MSNSLKVYAVIHLCLIGGILGLEGKSLDLPCHVHFDPKRIMNMHLVL